MTQIKVEKKFNCHGSIALNNGCTRKVTKQHTLCPDCKQDYWAKKEGSKRGRTMTIAQMQEELLNWSQEARVKRLQDQQLQKKVQQELL